MNPLMKKSFALVSFLGAALLSFNTAQAEHGHIPANPTYGNDRNYSFELIRETQDLVFQASQLDRTAQQSWLRFEVKSSVSQFVNSAYQFQNCLNQRRQCRFEFRDLNQNFHAVRQFLYDTMHDFPAVYHQFVQTRNALQEVRREYREDQEPGYPEYPTHPGHPSYPNPPYPPAPLPAPVPAPGFFQASGSLDSLQFFFQGDRISIFHQCMNRLAMINARWIQNVFVNGLSYHAGYGRFFDGNTACQFVSNNAR
jgi:hypothetical protein